MATIKLLKQIDETGCGIACVSMITILDNNKDYPIAVEEVNIELYPQMIKHKSQN